LLGYHQMISAVRGSLRDLVEVHALSMFMSGAVSREVEPIVYTSVGANLPFVEEPDLGLSLVVKSYLDEASNDPNKRSDIERWFNHAYDIKGDLKKAWMMWGAVSVADNFLVTMSIANTFTSLDQRRYPGRRQCHRQQRHQEHLQERRRVAHSEAAASQVQREGLNVSFAQRSTACSDAAAPNTLGLAFALTGTCGKSDQPLGEEACS
jgi:hypothetical protein